MKKSDKLAFFSNYRDESKKIDLESGVVTDLSPTDKKIRLQDVLQDGRSHYLFETRDNAPDKIRLVKLTEDFQETEEIIFRNDLFKNDYFSNELLGSNTFEGKRYWLAYLRNHLHYLDKGFYGNLLRLWENGRVENFPIASGIFADYLNNLIFIYAKEGLAILKDTGSGFETVKTISKNKRLSFRIGDYFSHRRVPSDSPLMKNVYFIIDDKIVRLDLETLEIQEIADVKSGTNVRVMNYPIDGSFVVEEDPALRKETFYRLEGDRLNPVRTFSLEKVKDIEFPEQKPFTEWKEQFDVSEGGVIYQKGKTVRVFAWPDLRELKFKGL